MPEQVEIKTHDQTTLRGLFYPAGSKPPVVIMSAGLSGLKEHFIDRFAERFQKAGFAALIYDHRNWGGSDGFPRHHSNHYEQTQDAHDVIYYASTRPDIDPNRIAIWGSSFSGGIAITGGAVDPRIKAVISQVPFISGNALRTSLLADLLSAIYADRGGTTSTNPTYLPVFPESLEEAQSKKSKAVMATEEAFQFHQLRQHLHQTRKENKITLQTMFHAMWSEPKAFITHISPKPLFMLVALQDFILNPQLQLNAFASAGEPKQLLKQDCGHFDVYQGDWFEENISEQIDFLKQHL